MAICGHCNKEVGGIRDHIKDKHGFPFYTMGPDFRYYGKNDPPHKQKDDMPDLNKTS
jgi:hypothetical protein